MSAEAPIGVFDSGIGGLSVLRALRAELPAERFVYFADAGEAPYGERGDAFVAARTLEIARQLREAQGIKALVVACNTATAAAIHRLREQFTGWPVIGVEPALKPAVTFTRTGRIAVLATRGTLTSAKFAQLHDGLRGQAEFVLQPCDGLAAAIEADDAGTIAQLCRRYTVAAHRFGERPGEIDTLVLGCTHYPFVEPVLRACVGPRVRMVETGEPVARQTRRQLTAAGLLRPAGAGEIEWQSSGSVAALRAAAGRWGIGTGG